MSIVISIINIIAGIAEFLALVVCIELLGIFKSVKISVSRFIFAITVFVALSTLILYFNNSQSKFVVFIIAIVYTSKNLIVLFIMYRHLNLKIIYLTVFINLMIAFTLSCISCVSANILDVPLEEIDSFAAFFTRIIVLFVMLVLKQKIDSKKTMTVLQLIPKRIFVLLILSIICLSALTSLVSYHTDDFKAKESLLIVIIILLSVILACIVVSLILNVIAKQHFTAVSQMMEKQVELQISHYAELEKMDAEIRRFRHDYTNHLQSILSLIQMKAYTDAVEYIEKIQKTAYSSGTVMFYSGNKLADAILTDKSAALDENCRIEYSGIMPTSIENVDLCVILSNSLDNAIEACREVHSPCTISVFAGEQQGYFVMSIKNPTARSDSFYDIPPTTKSKKEQHGMGLYNIESAVKKYNGQMKIKCENGIFELMITMKL